jgi:glycosyltransferase involved in cell wall biosynthesis
MTHSDVTICIPAFNESAAIRDTLTSLKTEISEAEIIVVDDGSSDDTGDLARSIDGVIVIKHERNRGYGAALKTAMRRSTRGVVAWYDSDGQHTPSDLKRVLQPVLEGEKDVVIGTRNADSSAPRDRVLGKWILKHIAQFVAGDRIPDLNSGMRCFRKDAIMRYLHLLPDGFSASTTTTLLMMKRGYRMGYVGITAKERIGKSTVKILRDGLRTTSLILRILILFEAFKIFAIASLLQLIPGVVYGLTVAITVGQGFPVLAAVLVLSGILTFLNGLICDQIVASRKEKFE